MNFYHQSGANVDIEISKIKFYFGEKRNFIQVGNGYIEFDIKIRKDDNSIFSIIASGHDVIRLVYNVFAYTFHDARISTSSGVEIEQNTLVNPVSTIMRLVTQKDDDLLYIFRYM